MYSTKFFFVIGRGIKGPHVFLTDDSLVSIIYIDIYEYDAQRILNIDTMVCLQL